MWFVRHDSYATSLPSQNQPDMSRFRVPSENCVKLGFISDPRALYKRCKLAHTHTYTECCYKVFNFLLQRFLPKWELLLSQFSVKVISLLVNIGFYITGDFYEDKHLLNNFSCESPLN